MKRCRAFLYILYLLVVPLSAQEHQSICLNMIVKNESEVIRRCLSSVKPFIDHWVIVDTGSTDGTQDIIREFMKDIPGELYERPWKNFEENRNEALQLAEGKGDYFLFMDADDWLEYAPGYTLPHLTLDMYNMWRIYPGYSFLNTHFVKAGLPWKWKGVVHEFIYCFDRPFSRTALENITYRVGNDGSSHKDPKKFLKYISLLEEALKKNPEDIRDLFSLAKSYEGAALKEKALELYEKLYQLCMWEEERFWSLFQIAGLQHELNFPIDTVINSYYRAHLLCPFRAEPIYCLTEIYNQQHEYALAYALLKTRECMAHYERKSSYLNLDWMDDFGLLFQRALSAFHLGKYQESLDASTALLEKNNIPTALRQTTEQNRHACLKKLRSGSK